ncbi:hypothetical protein [uncultured Flavobacterium sp.]|uniref:hypothetical protein n=1 Tax=uncultured Flavobacterium sp. TaxID=165435 RepID=UPI0030EB9FE3|tara:strand:- start:163 stop:462 length:300 start_codon:yes stop_codon:yes gene_type:complete
MSKDEIIQPKVKTDKKTKLILGIAFDLVGMLSYVVPVFAETTDIFWAPISGFIMMAMYKGTTGKVAGIISFVEEAFPFIDFIPTFTLTWVYKYVIKKES